MTAVAIMSALIAAGSVWLVFYVKKHHHLPF